MTIVDANLLLFAVDERSRFHAASREWLTNKLNGRARVGLPWQTLTAFLRISTNPRAYDDPLDHDVAWRRVDEWLDADAAWIPIPTERHQEVLGELIRTYGLRADNVPDAELAALAIEHGVSVASADTDFARFAVGPAPVLTWENPLA